MNIIFVNSIKAGEYGGGEKWILKAAEGLIQKGHRIFIASRPNSLLIKRANELHLNTININIRADFDLKSTLQIYRLLKQHHIEILICNFNKDVRVAGLAARLAGTPVVLARHGVVLCGKAWKYKITLKNLTDGIITNSKAVYDTYMSYGWFKGDFIHILYNGVEDKSATIPFDYSLQFPGKRIIFSAGRLTPQKGFDILIEALHLLSKKHQDVILLIAGSGSEKLYLKRKIQELNLADKVYFLGFIKDISPYLKASDVVALASRFEGMPNVLLEAMALEKAVVATAVDGTMELVEDGKSGLLVSSENSNAFARALEILLENGNINREYGKNALIQIQENFSMDKMINALEQYLQIKLNQAGKM